jgi:hypothetical protein
MEQSAERAIEETERSIKIYYELLAVPLLARFCKCTSQQSVPFSPTVQRQVAPAIRLFIRHGIHICIIILSSSATVRFRLGPSLTVSVGIKGSALSVSSSTAGGLCFKKSCHLLGHSLAFVPEPMRTKALSFRLTWNQPGDCESDHSLAESLIN